MHHLLLSVYIYITFYLLQNIIILYDSQQKRFALIYKKVYSKLYYYF